MQDTWQGLLKQQITELDVQNPVEWLDVNLSTSGLLNLTIVSDHFVGLSLYQHSEQQDFCSSFTLSSALLKVSINLYAIWYTKSKRYSKGLRLVIFRGFSWYSFIAGD